MIGSRLQARQSVRGELLPLTGHIRGNYESLNDYLQDIKRILFKWLNRRSQRRSYNWTGFIALIADFNLLKPRICHDF
jgi:hypothetical protein